MARRHVKAADIPGLLEDVISDFELSDREDFTSDSSGSDISTSTSSPPPKRRCSSPVRISESSDIDLGGTAESIHWDEVAESNTQAQLPFCYTETVGPKHIPSPPMTPIQYFYLFFTTSLLNSIVTQRNNYARTFLQSQKNISPHSQVLKWTDVTVTELKGFIACLLNMGIKRQPTISSYWSVSPSLNNPWFRSMFSRNRFQLILKFFHLVDNKNLAGPGQPGYDPCAKFQPLIDHANALFRHHYVPHQQLSVDESLVGTKNHKQLLFFVYREAKDVENITERKKFGLAYTGVMKLLNMGNCLRKGYHIFMDNFFTSIPLAKELYKLQTFVTSTVRRNRKYLPAAFGNKFQIGQKQYFRSGPILTVAYREKKSQRSPVLLLSTHGQTSETEYTRVRHGNRETLRKPQIIHSYNQFMGGIDTSDMMVYSYLSERRTVKYWKKYASVYFLECC
ncbi:hypothetical protein B7P43_G17701 [Cryptotermes secundus]|uniref:PiggyBac transposable element-derived protein domain-containing protein n=1 Tax=Cryptotermes secundus TaxID=105785 RepID=A0A2J7QUJ6_9NEOP|nr:hypothetical protein B7P43_G17701 [Cryptotermes secundus]